MLRWLSTRSAASHVHSIQPADGLHRPSRRAEPEVLATLSGAAPRWLMTSSSHQLSEPTCRVLQAPFVDIICTYTVVGMAASAEARLLQRVTRFLIFDAGVRHPDGTRSPQLREFIQITSGCQR